MASLYRIAHGAQARDAVDDIAHVYSSALELYATSSADEVVRLCRSAVTDIIARVIDDTLQKKDAPMSDASTPHCKACGRVACDCFCQGDDESVRDDECMSELRAVYGRKDSADGAAGTVLQIVSAGLREWLRGEPIHVADLRARIAAVIRDRDRDLQSDLMRDLPF